MFDRNVGHGVEFIAHTTIESVRDEDRTRKTEKGKAIIDKIAILKDYNKIEPPKRITEELERKLEALPKYNNQNSIRIITPDIYDSIVNGKPLNSGPLRFIGDRVSTTLTVDFGAFAASL